MSKKIYTDEDLVNDIWDIINEVDNDELNRIWDKKRSLIGSEVEMYDEVEMYNDMDILEVIELSNDELQNDIEVAIETNDEWMLNYLYKNYEFNDEQEKMVMNFCKE